jgi:hypothetical protein
MTKDEILDEIRRTTVDNGGRPLGYRRFAEVTGISQYAWGRFWSRFADAQREAGFEPNERNEALDPTLVLRRYLGLVRELQGIPTYRELRVQRTRDASFPDSTVFYRPGSGGKNAFLGRVLEFVRETPGYEDVASLVEAAHVPEGSRDSSARGEATSDAAVGFVYLARGHRGEYKLGRTNLVDRRISEVGATGPVELELVHEIKTDDPAGVEAYWHRRFADRRMRGEWFLLNAADVKAFKRWRRLF